MNIISKLNKYKNEYGWNSPISSMRSDLEAVRNMRNSWLVQNTSIDNYLQRCVCNRKRHQLHLKNDAVANAVKKLKTKMSQLENCSDFESLRDMVYEIIARSQNGCKLGIGNSTVYDTAIRLGYSFPNIILPHEYVYVHRHLIKNAKKILEDLYSDEFVIEDRRDLYEYLYKYETIAIMDGSYFKAKRNEIRKFFKTYENTEIKKITEEDVANIKKLHKLWVDASEERQKNKQLDFEEIALDRALQHYTELGLDGIVISCDGNPAGFVFGVKLNDEVFDFMIEKANTNYRGIYKVLNNELAKVCCSEYKFVNFEEDLGEEGLRNSKMMYHPDLLFKKFVAMEA
jgi:hypothetical protein